MRIFRKIKDLKQYLQSCGDKTRGFVPTMGYLHQGHMSLVKRSVEENDISIVSVFVNPTQFGPREDLATYPRDLDRDAAMCEREGADALFAPDPEEMYGTSTHTWVFVEGVTDVLCGASRPGHFRGVCTVVTKLFNIVAPRRAYFGMKDYQQYRVLSTMVKDLNMDVEVVPCPIVRESDGLAMSSRNRYLDGEKRQDALVLNKALARVKELLKDGERDTARLRAAAEEIISQASSARIDYLETVHPETLEKVEKADGGVLTAMAVYIGSTRLIDNMLWKDDK